MKLSIITITYNNADGLRKTLASVAAQTFRDFEHIIVDGGSTDGSVEIIRQYADSEAIRPENSKADNLASSPHHLITSSPIIWISEKDRGVYDAQFHLTMVIFLRQFMSIILSNYVNSMYHIVNRLEDCAKSQ